MKQYQQLFKSLKENEIIKAGNRHVVGGGKNLNPIMGLNTIGDTPHSFAEDRVFFKPIEDNIRCPDCGVKPYQVAGSDEWECDCGKPVVYMYQNHCWFCGPTRIINEMNSEWSETPGMGLVCYNCKNDLSGLKR